MLKSCRPSRKSQFEHICFQQGSMLCLDYTACIPQKSSSKLIEVDNNKICRYHMQNLIGLYHAKLIKPVNGHRMLNPGNDYWVKKKFTNGSSVNQKKFDVLSPVLVHVAITMKKRASLILHLQTCILWHKSKTLLAIGNSISSNKFNLFIPSWYR